MALEKGDHLPPEADPTIASLLMDPSFAAYYGHLYAGILEVRLGGVAIGALGLGFGIPSATQDICDEIISVANVLAVTGHKEPNLVKDEAPDFHIESDGEQFDVEHTRAVSECITDSAKYFMRDGPILCREGVVADAMRGVTALISVEHSAIEVGPIQALSESCPQEHMSNREARTVIKELRELALSGYLRTLVGRSETRIPGDIATTLARFRATAHVDVSVAPDRAGIFVSTRRFEPGKRSLFDACVDAIHLKRKTVKKYERVPDWLVIQVCGFPEEFLFDLADYVSPDIAPFNRVSVLYWHDRTPYVSTWTQEHDGAVSASIPELPEIPDQRDGLLHEWADEVEAILERLRSSSTDTEETELRPQIATSPVHVQWFRAWLGNGPWATCHRVGDCAVIRLWYADAWEAGDVVRLPLSECAEAARLIWEFVMDGP